MRIQLGASLIPSLARHAVAALVMLALAAPAAAADAQREAKQHFKRGATEYNLGHFREAIAAFQQAYRLDPSPILLYNIASAHRKLGENEQALFFFRRYLSEDPETKDRAKVEQWITELEAATRPATPPAPPPAVSPPPPARAEPTPAPALQVQAPPPAAEAASRRWRRPVAWASAGVAAAALGLGIYETVRFNDKRHEFGRLGPCGEAEPNQGTNPQCKKLYDSGKQAQTIAVVSYIASGVLAGAATALLVTDRRAEAPSAAAFLRSCRPTGPGVSCGLAF
jgi:tetratricopeptide (TPR) repeat protein